MHNIHYTSKERSYFSYVRKDVMSLLPENSDQRILEIGAGGGNTLLYLKENKLAAEVMGIELMDLPDSNQRNPMIDRFQIANIEIDRIDAQEEYFDVIICADVLEHLSDPWTVVNEISKYLKKGGRLIVSIPNLREFKTLSRLVFYGDFRYEKSGGIMDITHLRFFARKNIVQLLNTDSLELIYCKPNFLLKKEVPEAWKRRLINRCTFGLFRNFLAIQYLCIAVKK